MYMAFLTYTKWQNVTRKFPFEIWYGTKYVQELHVTLETTHYIWSFTLTSSFQLPSLFKKCKWFQMFETPECKATNIQRVGKYIKHI